MSRPDCISNRNIRIIAAYVKNRIGSHPSLFDGLSYPRDEYLSAQDFFLNEDEWTTYDNFEHIFRKGKDLVGEPDFFFKCGASSARLRSWGRFHYFVRVFATPDDGYRRLPFFNKNFNDTKEIDVISPPAFDPNSKKVRTLLKIQFHRDIDPNRDYIGDPYLRGIVSAIPPMWGMPPAVIRQPLLPYDPVILFNQDPEFTSYRLDVRMEAALMTLKAPDRHDRLIVGKEVLLVPEVVNGKEVFLGKYTEVPPDLDSAPDNQRNAILIIETLRLGNQTLFTAGEIFKAPYLILDISYDRLSIFRRLSQIFRIRGNQRDSGDELVETINQLRKSMASRNQAYVKLESTLSELMDAKARLDETNRELERRVERRTLELREAQQQLILLNSDLEAKVQAQVVELENEADLTVPEVVQFIVRERQEVAVFKAYQTRIGIIQRPKDIQKSCLPRSGGPQDGHTFSFLHGKIEIFQHNLQVAVLCISVAFRQFFNLYKHSNPNCYISYEYTKSSGKAVKIELSPFLIFERESGQMI